MNHSLRSAPPPVPRVPLAALASLAAAGTPTSISPRFLSRRRRYLPRPYLCSLVSQSPITHRYSLAIP
eukprot:scaffold18207_cov129-Isochrysis_galbana.AAC.1